LRLVPLFSRVRKRFFPSEFIDAVKLAPKPKPLDDEAPKITERSPKQKRFRKRARDAVRSAAPG
jgi:hypothetical protein